MPNGDAAGAVLDPLKNELENQKLRAEVRKTDAEARKAQNDLLVSHIPTEIPSGTLEAPAQPSPIGVLAAYRALDAVAVTIAACVPPGAGQVWIVPDDRASGHRALHALLQSQLARFERTVEDTTELLGEGAPRDDRLDLLGAAIREVQGVMPLPAALASIPAVLSLFKTDVTLRNRDVTIPFEALAACVAQQIALKPGASPDVRIAGISPPGTGELLGRVQSLELLRDWLAATLSTYRAGLTEQPALAAATARIAALRTLLETLAKSATPDMERLTGLVDTIAQTASEAAVLRQDTGGRAAVAEAVEQVLEATDAFLGQIQTPGPSGATPLSVADGYDPAAHVLVVSVSYAGGESVYEQVVARKDRAQHLGAAVVSYALVAPDGTVTSSGVAKAHDCARSDMGSPTIDWSSRTSLD